MNVFFRFTLASQNTQKDKRLEENYWKRQKHIYIDEKEKWKYRCRIILILLLLLLFMRSVYYYHHYYCKK